MVYFKINVLFMAYIVGIGCVLPHPFPCQYFLPYAIPLNFLSDFVVFGVLVYNCSVNVFGSSVFFEYFVNVFFYEGYLSE